MPDFNSKDEEIRHWRDKCTELEKDLSELSESSKQIENELETLLDEAERNNKELRTKNNRMKLDFETLQDKFSVFQSESLAQIVDLQEENQNFRTREEDYKKYIRELEQKNDDLERLQRETYVSLREFDERFNTALERNAILELELDEKESLKATVQRMKDEASELRQELKAQEKRMMSEQEKSAADRRRSSFRLATASLDTTPNKNKNVNNSNSILTNSTTNRSAMDIVGDILRKVGDLEVKLADCRSYLNCNNEPKKSYRRSLSDSRKSRLNRGTSTPSIHNLVKS